MNWRRGILLAGINLAVVVPLLVQREFEYEAWVRESSAERAQNADRQNPEAASSEDEGVAINTDPCKWIFDYSTRQVLLRELELLPSTVSGWDLECPPHWSLAGRLKVGYSWVETPSMIPAHREVALGFCLVVMVQWILVGAFALVRPKRWWVEPGAFITCCTVIGFVLILIRPIQEFARLQAFLAALAWFWWLGLLIWKIALLAWKLIARRHATVP